MVNVSGKCQNLTKIGNKERRCRKPSGKEQFCLECRKAGAVSASLTKKGTQTEYAQPGVHAHISGRWDGNIHPNEDAEDARQTT